MTSLLALFILSAPSPDAVSPDIAVDGPILFLGDSITYARRYVDYIEMQYRLHAAQTGQSPPTILSIGLGSETVCGMTEEGHPFPRPNVHTRLDRALAAIKPRLVFACYGMNDGIYMPYDEERFACYSAGILKLTRDVLASGAELVLVTPPPFDAKGRRDNGKPLVTAAQQAAGETGLYDEYDDVLAKYAAFVLSVPDRQEFAGQPLSAIDIRTPMLDATAAGRKTAPNFTLAKDGIHPGVEGHRVMAEAILAARNARPERVDPSTPRGERIASLITRRSAPLRDAWLTEIGHSRPRTKAGLPLPEAEAKAAAVEKSLLEAYSKLLAADSPAPAALPSE